ncbi:hypothetical protein [Paenibacillus sp. OK076]|uniref:hypothetical protein n=1 Tax=Paenibacillus sp. OK076 TaxID=1884379 RepID=UPI000B805D38|nr:hypothetical protein [Paenibacillus sp. OK076]
MGTTLNSNDCKRTLNKDAEMLSFWNGIIDYSNSNVQFCGGVEDSGSYVQALCTASCGAADEGLGNDETTHRYTAYGTERSVRSEHPTDEKIELDAISRKTELNAFPRIDHVLLWQD